jgi:hypothetical protein
MDYGEIDLTILKKAVNAILDHLIEDLRFEKVAIDVNQDFYWDCPVPAVYDSSTKPTTLDTGRLSDDVDFVKKIDRGRSQDVSYNLIHVAPLLRYIGERVKR